VKYFTLGIPLAQRDRHQTTKGAHRGTNHASFKIPQNLTDHRKNYRYSYSGSDQTDQRQPRESSKNPGYLRADPGTPGQKRKFL